MTDQQNIGNQTQSGFPENGAAANEVHDEFTLANNRIEIEGNAQGVPESKNHEPQGRDRTQREQGPDPRRQLGSQNGTRQEDSGGVPDGNYVGDIGRIQQPRQLNEENASIQQPQQMNEGRAVKQQFQGGFKEIGAVPTKVGGT